MDLVRRCPHRRALASRVIRALWLSAGHVRPAYSRSDSCAVTLMLVLSLDECSNFAASGFARFGSIARRSFRMAFERLDSIVTRVLSRVDGLGEAEIAVSAIRPKGTGTNAVPAKFTRNVIQAETPEVGAHTASLPRIGRSITTASPTRRPSAAVVIDLAMYRDEVGRRAEGGGSPRPASVRRNAPGSELRGTVLAFEARSHSNLANSPWNR